MSLHLIAFLAIFCGGLVLTVAADLSWGVALYELLYFIFPANRWWYTIPRFRYTFVVGLVLIAVYLFRKRSAGHTGPLLFPQAKVLLVMIALMVAISFWAVWPEQHSRFLVLQIQQFIFLFIAYQAIDREEKFDRVLWAYLAGCFYVGYLAHGMPRDGFGRLEGMGMPDGPEANTTAAVLITAIPLLLYHVVYGKNPIKIISLGMIAFIMNAIILFNSRGAILGLSAGVTLFVFLLMRGHIITVQQKIYIIFALIVTFLLFLYLADTTFWSRMATLQEIDPGEGTATRTEFWLAAWNLARDYPLGVGARGFEYLSPEILPHEWLSPNTGTRAIHSLYFEAISEFGYPGIILLSAFLWTTFRGLHKVRNSSTKNYVRSISLQSSFISFLVAAIFINRLYSEVFYWLMLFSAIHCNISNQKHFIGDPHLMVKEKN